MERPNATTIAYYDRNVPADPRAVKGQMFGHPCAFVNGNMFFGTFAQTVVARVGKERAAALLGPNLRIFEPMAGRAWAEYVQWGAEVLPDQQALAFAQEALEATAAMPAKEKKKPAAKKAK